MAIRAPDGANKTGESLEEEKIEKNVISMLNSIRSSFQRGQFWDWARN